MKITMKSLLNKTPLMVVFAIAMIVFGSAQAFATTFLVNPPEDNGYATCTPPSAANFTVNTINTALNAAVSGDTIYVCPKYATAGAAAGPVLAYNETLLINKALNILAISDTRGSRVTIAANPATNVLPQANGSAVTNGIVVFTAGSAGSASVSSSFGNFVVDGAVGAAGGVGPAGTVTSPTTNYTGTTNYNGIVLGAGSSGTIVFSNTVQNIRINGQVGLGSALNSNGDGITIIGTGTAAATAAGTAANPVQINNNLVQNFRSDGISAAANSSAFVRGNYVIGTGNGTINGIDNTGQTTNQSGVQFTTATSNGDIFNNRLTNFQFNQNTGGGSACSLGAFVDNCPVAILLDATGSANGNSIRVRFNNISNSYYGTYAQDVQFGNFASNNIYSSFFGMYFSGNATVFGANFNTITSNTIVSSRVTGIYLGISGGDASIGNTINTNTFQDAYAGIINNTPAVNNTITNTGATANTFISVNLFTVADPGNGNFFPN